MGLSGLSVKTLKNHERMELSWANHVYNTEFSVETSLEHGFAIENTYFLWKLERFTFCTLFSLLERFKRF